MNRYHRQELLPVIGPEGQARLRQASALIVGCGALGCVLAESLTRAGIGRLVIADRDFVSLTNLQRQTLFTESDARDGIPKAIAAQRRLREINSDVQLDIHVDDVNATNLQRFAGVDGDAETQPVNVLLDGTDNFPTRYLLDDVAHKHGIPYIYGGVIGTLGATLSILPRTETQNTPWEQLDLTSPSLRDLYPAPPDPGTMPTCDTAGVLGPAVNVVASLQAAEALKILTGQWAAVSRQLRHLDLWSNTFRTLNISGSASDADTKREYPALDNQDHQAMLSLCGSNAVQILAPRRNGASLKLDLPALAARFESLGAVRQTNYLLRVTLTDEPAEPGPRDDGGSPSTDSAGSIVLTIFPDGRAIVQGTSRPERARAIYDRYLGG